MSLFGSGNPARRRPSIETLPTSLARPAWLAHPPHDVQVDAARKEVGPRMVERTPVARKETGLQTEQYIAALNLQPASYLGSGRQGADLGPRDVQIHVAGSQQQVQHRAGEAFDPHVLRQG